MTGGWQIAAHPDPPIRRERISPAGGGRGRIVPLDPKPLKGL